MNFLVQTESVNLIIEFLKIYFISIFTIHMSVKITNKPITTKYKRIIQLIIIFFCALCTLFVKYKMGFFYSLLIMILLLAMLFSKFTDNNLGYTIIIVTISLSINYIIFFLAIAISFLPNALLQIKNRIIGLVIIMAIYFVMIYFIARIKRFKNGLIFLQKRIENEYFDVLILNVGLIILFSVIMLSNYTKIKTGKVGFGFIVSSIIMIISIQKSLQLYYKQKLLVQELEETKAELESTKKELENANEENLSFSKKSHSLVHKQKSLEYKLNQILQNAEIGEEIGISKDEIESRIKEISKELYTESAPIELTKTGIIEIDDMLKYMQSECIKNKIEFNVQISGNIYHMINELITKEDLEILLADHIKNAIIAINHSENSNKSILVKLGKIDNIYSLYIYDTGVEFKKETLENLGKIPSTTYADEGGTGMGFMNTFDTLRRSSASLIIEEIGELSKDNYTKAIIIKFDKKNEFNIKSYKEEKSCN